MGAPRPPTLPSYDYGHNIVYKYIPKLGLFFLVFYFWSRDQFFVIVTKFWSRWQFQLSSWPNFCHDDKKLVAMTIGIVAWPIFSTIPIVIVTKFLSRWQKIGHASKNKKPERKALNDLFKENSQNSSWLCFHFVSLLLFYGKVWKDLEADTNIQSKTFYTHRPLPTKPESPGRREYNRAESDMLVNFIIILFKIFAALGEK